jgi:hypothetical protein
MSFRATICADGRFVTFTSAASNLVPGDTQGRWGVFVRDRKLGITERVSVASDGRDADDDSRGSSISADGRVIAFNSRATNLVPEADEGTWHVYVRDRKLGTTERVDVSGDGAPADASSMGWSISSDGRFVSFTSTAKNLVPGGTTPHWRVFVRDRELARTELVSVGTDGQEADGPIHFLAYISADGRFVTFTSNARNLAPGGAQGEWDVFVRDRRSMTTERLAVAMDGAEANGESAMDSVGSPISTDGRFMAFTSAASNLVPGDANDVQDAFVRDRGLQTTERVSVRGDQRDPRAPTAVAESDEPGHARTAGRSETASAADAGDVGSPTAMMDVPLRRLNNDVWLCPEDVRLINPLDGEPGEIRAFGSVHVMVPFFARNSYTFIKSGARVTWRGAHPFYVDRIEHVETWSVDSHGGAVSIEDAPPGPASNGSGSVERRTEVADTQTSEQSWDRMVFLAAGVGFRVRFKVAATFQFGSTTFVISAEDAALT